MDGLSVQLYSIRDALAADLPGALARLASLGVTQVEPFDVVSDPDGLRDALAATGLSAPSVHARVGAGVELDRVFEAAAAVGARTVVQAVQPARAVELRGGRRRRRGRAGPGRGRR
jgi:hypothetical protein